MKQIFKQLPSKYFQQAMAIYLVNINMDLYMDINIDTIDCTCRDVIHLN